MAWFGGRNKNRKESLDFASFFYARIDRSQGMNTIFNPLKQELLRSAGKRKAGFEMLENGTQLLNINGFRAVEVFFNFGFSGIEVSFLLPEIAGELVLSGNRPQNSWRFYDSLSIILIQFSMRWFCRRVFLIFASDSNL